MKKTYFFPTNTSCIKKNILLSKLAVPGMENSSRGGRERRSDVPRGRVDSGLCTEAGEGFLARRAWRFLCASGSVSAQAASRPPPGENWSKEQKQGEAGVEPRPGRRRGLITRTHAEQRWWLPRDIANLTLYRILTDLGIPRSAINSLSSNSPSL